MDLVLDAFIDEAVLVIGDNFVPAFLLVSGIMVAVVVGPRIFRSLLNKFRI